MAILRSVSASSGARYYTPLYPVQGRLKLQSKPRFMNVTKSHIDSVILNAPLDKIVYLIAKRLRAFFFFISSYTLLPEKLNGYFVTYCVCSDWYAMIFSIEVTW